MDKYEAIIEEIDSWDQYLKLVNSEKYADWAFRGQRDAAWQLWTRQEHRNIRIFVRKAIQFLEKVPDTSDTFRWMAIMQHHGAPTRLLDFTWSPYVAAFFALESATSNSAVWAINTFAVGTYCFGPKIPDGNEIPSPQEALAFYGYKNMDDVAIGEPFFKNRRLIAQSGTFACPYDLARPIDEILGKTENSVAKFVLKGSKLRQEALNELYRMNITHATLFPDLDGLARSLRYELETHYLYDPTRT
jgi:hypothetical protein